MSDSYFEIIGHVVQFCILIKDFTGKDEPPLITTCRPRYDFSSGRQPINRDTTLTGGPVADVPQPPEPDRGTSSDERPQTTAA